MNVLKSYVFLVVLHVLLGLIIFFVPIFSKIYFIICLVYFLARIILAKENRKIIEILNACAYFVGFEVLFRMTKGAPTYEIVKYLVIVFALIGMFYKGISGKGYPYFLYVLLLIPSIIVASTTLSFDANFRTNIAFVLSGPICLGVATLFCYDKRVKTIDIENVLLLIGLPIISLTTYVYIYTPSVKDVLTSTVSTAATAGGFGANQVATVLGLGMFVFTTRIFTNSPSVWLKFLNSAIVIFITYRALVTFSRGGVIVAAIAILAFILYYYFNSSKYYKSKVLGVILLLIMSFSLAWIISNKETNGWLNLRYENKDHLGRPKDDLTTGRVELFLKELDGFIKNPFVGIGSSRAKDMRLEIEGQGITSHSEVSRILAEHGILGVLILIILIFKPLDFRSSNRSNYFFFAFLCFWFFTVNHSAMRIAAPAFLYAIALLKVINEKTAVHRKQIR